MLKRSPLASAQVRRTALEGSLSIAKQLRKTPTD